MNEEDVLSDQKLAYKLYNSDVRVTPIGEMWGSNVESIEVGSAAKELSSSVVVIERQENI